MISAVINYEDGKVSVHTSKAKTVSDKFPSGFFEASVDDKGFHISEKELSELHEPFKSEENTIILNTVYSFFKEDIRQKVNKLGFTHKLGVLLHGIAGTGKTSTLNFVANLLIKERNAIVFFCNNSSTLAGAIALAKMVRQIQDNPIIFIADEFERYASKAESEMKNFLDGNDSIDNTLFLAATNYIEEVPQTLKERPSRFRVVLEVKGIEDKALIKEVLTNISNKIDPCLFTKKEIEEQVSNCKNVTLDQIKHIALDKVTNSFVKVKSKNKIGFSTKEEKESKSIGINKNSMINSYGLIFNNIFKKEAEEFNGTNI